jgi:predicted metal-binding membrane protein
MSSPQEKLLPDLRFSVLESVLRRDRNIVAVALILLTVLAWAYLLHLNAAISASPMAAMPGMNMGAAPQPLAPSELGYAVVMWAVMMAGMMTPSAAPMILLYARVGRQARAQGAVFAATGWFAAGYLAAWTLFAIVAAVAQAGLMKIVLMTPAMVIDSNLIAGALLLLAGIWQWLPLKDRCLAQCQAPLAFLQRVGGFRRSARAAFAQGAKHGFYCVGCCWALMLLLFVGGVMNLLWVAALSIFILLEKLVPNGKFITRGAGLVAITAGIVFLGKSLI